MLELETVLLIIVVVAALAGGLFLKAKPGLIVLMVAFSYFVVAFFLFDKSETLWFVTLMMGFCLAAVGAMVGAFSGRALSKLLPGRR
ncbi:MAG: hypothetical protein WA908_04570 [Pontixanthobacter sp.]